MTGIFIAVEARARSPIMPLSLYADPVVAVSAVIMLLTSFGLYGSVLFLPLFFQVAFGFSAAQSGGLLVPMLLGMVVGGIVAGQVLSGASGTYRMQATVFVGLMAARAVPAFHDGRGNRHCAEPDIHRDRRTWYRRHCGDAFDRRSKPCPLRRRGNGHVGFAILPVRSAA